MPRFITGDQLGNLKSLQVSTADGPSELTQLHSAKSSVAALSIPSVASTSKLAAVAYADGSLSAFTIHDNDLQIAKQWKENRLKPDQIFVGLQSADRGIYSCTSNGALRLVPSDAEDSQPLLGSLPTRLNAWRLDSEQATFIYAGDEVEPSMWNTELAFKQTESSTAKRKRDALFPGEIWRAKNVQNDGLGLRQPVKITSLTFLSSPTTLLAGTQFGDVRRYDTRAARRPVSNWKDVGKAGGIKVEKGLANHEVFVSDHGSNLFALDTRNGRIVYSYKGLSGAVTSMAPSPSLLVSAALDRYCRMHTSFAPPLEAGKNQEHKGEVIEKVFMTSVPSVVAWDCVEAETPAPQPEAEDDDVWDGMENVKDSDDESRGKKRRRNAA
ncbi:WD repeat-containing protein 74 [Favolaschia claudopus]|uniref:Ribosome biogenesis protein NSA1 n=1 Tax=Favolaschia claudopus TaxID=2862362 RepID=A0AAW0AQ86_9AGAR